MRPTLSVPSPTLTCGSIKGRDTRVQRYLPAKNLPSFSSRPAPTLRSSSVLHPIVCGTKERDGHQAEPATTAGRQAIQPSICGVQPGQLLNLSPSLGLDKTSEFFVEQQKQLWQQHAQHKYHRQQLQLRQRSSKEIAEATRSSKGEYQRCCRLQPLGVVNAQVLKPEHLLGVIPITLAKNDLECRPKSSSAPIAIHCDKHTSNTKNKHRKRSYSAILSREFSGVELGEMLYLSSHLALVPQDEGRTELNHTSDGLRDGFIGLPSRTVGSKVSGCCSPGDKKSEQLISARRTPRVEKHAPIIKDLKVTHSHTPTTRIPQNIVGESLGKPTQKADSSTSTTTESTTFPPRISPRIVSIGEARGLERAMVGMKIKRNSSSGKGRLSHGWSSPQSMGGLKGSPIYIPTATAVHKQANMAKFSNEHHHLQLLRTREQ